MLTKKHRVEVKIPLPKDDNDLIVYPELFDLAYIDSVDEQQDLVTFSNGQQALSYILTLKNKVASNQVKSDLAKKFKNDIGVDPPFMSVGQAKKYNIPEGGFTQTVHLSGGGVSAPVDNPSKKPRGRPRKTQKSEGGEAKETKHKQTKEKASSSEKKQNESNVKEMKKAVAKESDEKEEEEEKGRKRSISSSSSSSHSSASSSSSGSARSPEAQNVSSSDDDDDENTNQKEQGGTSAGNIFDKAGNAINYDGTKNTLR